MARNCGLLRASERAAELDIAYVFAYAVGVAKGEMYQYRAQKEIAQSLHGDGDWRFGSAMDRAKAHRSMAYTIMLPFAAQFRQRAEWIRQEMADKREYRLVEAS